MTSGKKFDREFFINKVALMRIKGKSTYSILEFLQSVPMSRKVAYEVLKEAQTLIVEQQKKDLDDAIADSLAKLEDLYMTADNNKTKLDALKEYNKLKGMYVERIDLTSGGDKLQTIKFEIVTKKQDGENEDTQHQGD
jgi:hypothetical protein